MDDTDRKILNHLQDRFPVESRPYRVMGEALGLAEDETHRRVQRLAEQGYIRRLGPVLDTQAIGKATTLVVMKVPEERAAEVAELVNAHDQVSHNYLRADDEGEAPYNLWFTIAATSQAELDRVLSQVKDETGLPAYSLPATKKFKIGVRFKF